MAHTRVGVENAEPRTQEAANQYAGFEYFCGEACPVQVFEVEARL